MKTLASSKAWMRHLALQRWNQELAEDEDEILPGVSVQLYATRLRRRARAREVADFGFEGRMLDRIALETELSRLSPADRALVVIAFQHSCPPDYTGEWPPTLRDVYDYLGVRYPAQWPKTEHWPRRISEHLARLTAAWTAMHPGQCGEKERRAARPRFAPSPDDSLATDDAGEDAA